MTLLRFNEYQEKAAVTAVYPDIGNNFIYTAIGLFGETGEVANKLNKIIRDHDGDVSDESRLDLMNELGDVLWYLSSCASELNCDLEDIAKLNLEKLSSRRERNVIKGCGDNR